MSGFGETLHGGPVDLAEVARVRDIIVFEEPHLKERIVRFAVLLILASAIATFGLLADSVATVIGAMIVAPLMLPIMGLAFAMSIGDRRGIVSSLVIGISGMATAVLVGFLLSQPWGWVDPMSNAQIMARTAPRLVDLCAALATGLAGAFGMGRKDVSDTLPGVAIAISLVPPLANVGILLGLHRPDLASRSLLLFVTNYFAILLTGALMFRVMGFSRTAAQEGVGTAKWVGVVVALALTIVIAVPLSAQTYSVATDTLAENVAATATKAWVENSGYRFVSATADGDIRVVVAGEGELPEFESLRADLKGKVYGKQVHIEAVPEKVTILKTK